MTCPIVLETPAPADWIDDNACYAAGPRAAPFPAAPFETLQALFQAHRDRPPEKPTSRAMGLKPKPS